MLLFLVVECVVVFVFVVINVVSVVIVIISSLVENGSVIAEIYLLLMLFCFVVDINEGVGFLLLFYPRNLSLEVWSKSVQ